MAATYTCAKCGGTFDSARSDEEANAEALELFGVNAASKDDDMAVICDDCFRQMVPWLKQQLEFRG